MKGIAQKLNFLQAYISIVPNKYRPQVDETIKLFKERKIEKFVTADNILRKLSSRGKGPEAGIKDLQTYSVQPSVTNRLKSKTTVILKKVSCSGNHTKDTNNDKTKRQKANIYISRYNHSSG